MPTTVDIRPNLPHAFYNDISFVEELCSLINNSGNRGLFAGQQQTYQAYKSLTGVDADGEHAEDPLNNSTLKNFADRHQKKPVVEGVLSSDKLIPESFGNELRKLVFALQEAQDPEVFLPRIESVVQDVVHPSWYCYVSGESYVREELEGAAKALPFRINEGVFHNQGSDIFGRKYEGSKYQWLPTDVSVGMDGRARFLSPVNNLDMDQVKLHNSLEQLLTAAVPYFEEALGFVNRIGPLMHPDEEQTFSGVKVPDSSKSLFVSLKGKNIQVVPKIVTYHLKPGQTYSGRGHTDGLSQYNIAATGIFMLKRDKNIAGGDLVFKRQYTSEEIGQYMCNVPQSRNSNADAMICQGWQPLGKLATPEGRFIVFPNSHVHKRMELENVGSTPGSRTIVVFFLVHPDVKLISTAHVPCQHWMKQRAAAKMLMEKQMEKWGLADEKCDCILEDIMEFAKWGFTIEEAKEHRRELRKDGHKEGDQFWNLRKVKLCGH